MFHITTTKKVEFEVLCAILAVATLNVLIFSLLSAHPISHYVIMDDILETSIIYGTSIIAMLVLLLKKKVHLLKYVFYLLLGIITARVLFNLYSLVFDKRISDNGTAILMDAFLIWLVSLLVFSLWYWVVDRGGPVARATQSNETRYDLLFPQYQSKISGWDHWTPKFMDYIFFSFFTSTGFSPADTLPLTKRVKLLMMMEASISLIIIGMVASRAISLLQ
jgi:hypothetical protein